MWTNRLIETITEQRLQQELGETPGKERFALYLTARKHLVEQILPAITQKLPDHTDHGEDHIRNVLDNSAKLLGLDDANLTVQNSELSAMDLYCLTLSILFHDVGNVFGREEHQKNVAEIYNLVRPVIGIELAERRIVWQVTAAHCGNAANGSKDTLKELFSPCQLDSKPVRLLDIAAILRFADELAEGRQRTSLFMQKYHRYTPDNIIFHLYSNIVDILIDKGSSRIAISYDINIQTDGSRKFNRESEEKLRQLLEFTYKRIIKLDQERKYAKHYCKLLSPFRETAVAFNFTVDNYPLDFDFSRSVILNDLVIPGDIESAFEERCKDFNIDNVIYKIKANLKPDRGSEVQFKSL